MRLRRIGELNVELNRFTESLNAGYATRMIRHLHTLTVATLALFVCSCDSRTSLPQPQPSEQKPAAARLSESEAIKVAKTLAERFGANLSDYAEPKATYHRASDINVVWPFMAEGPKEPAFGDHYWSVYFGPGPKTDHPGGHFMVYVDDKTGRSRIVGGA